MRRTDGFTMIEVVIAVAIVGLLAAIAIPSYRTFVAKSRQVEARDGLENIYTLERAYRADKLTFGALADIGFVPEGAGRYTYCVTATSCVSATIDPTGIGAAGGDMGAGATSSGTSSLGGGSTCGGGSGGTGGTGTGGGPVGGGSGSGPVAGAKGGGGGGCSDPAAAPPLSADSATPPPSSSGSVSTPATGGTATVFAGKDTFYAVAAGKISTAPAPNDIDKWSVDDRKTILNFAVGY